MSTSNTPTKKSESMAFGSLENFGLNGNGEGNGGISTRATPKKSSTPGKKWTSTRFANSPACGDRFIPARSAIDIDLAHFQLLKENSNPQEESEVTTSPSRKEYQKQLAGTCCGNSASAKILAFKSKAPKPSEFDNPLHGIYSNNTLGQVTGVLDALLSAAGEFFFFFLSFSETFSPSLGRLCGDRQAPRNTRNARHIPAAPERILDAPDLVDDYYLNLLDWNKDNVISVALGSTVYLWNASSGEIQELCQTQHDDNIITSVSWHPESNFIGIGTNFSEVQIWDTQAQRQVSGPFFVPLFA